MRKLTLALFLSLLFAGVAMAQETPQPKAPAPEPTLEPVQPAIGEVALTGETLKIEWLDLSTTAGMSRFVALVHYGEYKPSVVKGDDASGYPQQICWNSAGGGVISSRCLLLQIQDSVTRILHLNAELKDWKGITTKNAVFRFSCDGQVIGQLAANYKLVDLKTGQTSKESFFLDVEPKPLVSPAGKLYLVGVQLIGETFYQSIYNPDGKRIVGHSGSGTFRFVSEEEVEIPVYTEPRGDNENPSSMFPRRIAERFNLKTGAMRGVYDKPDES